MSTEALAEKMRSRVESSGFDRSVKFDCGADGALEPLVYSPGPLDTADRTQWKHRTSSEILALRVADIAMGSGAFLVAACRYLAEKLVDRIQHRSPGGRRAAPTMAWTMFVVAIVA